MFSFLCFLRRVVQLWRENLGSVNNKAASSLADPEEYENLFPGFVEARKTEQFLRPQRKSLIPANKFSQVPVSQFENICNKAEDFHKFFKVY